MSARISSAGMDSSFPHSAWGFWYYLFNYWALVGCPGFRWQSLPLRSWSLEFPVVADSTRFSADQVDCLPWGWGSWAQCFGPSAGLMGQEGNIVQHLLCTGCSHVFSYSDLTIVTILLGIVFLFSKEETEAGSSSNLPKRKRWNIRDFSCFKVLPLLTHMLPFFLRAAFATPGALCHYQVLKSHN